MTLKSTKKNAKIHICNIQSAGEDRDRIELSTEGTFYRRGESFYLLYQEPDPETGLWGDSILLKVVDGTVVMKRIGGVSSEMRFKPGKTENCCYRMPYGSLEITLDCRRAAVELNDQGGWIQLDYILKIGSGIYQNDLTIQVEAGKDDV